MHYGMIGLGKMGGGMARRLQAHGFAVAGLDPEPAAQQASAAAGVAVQPSLETLLAALEPPRALWLSLPSGAPTEAMLEDLMARLAPGDAVIDAGNSPPEASRRHAAALAARGLAFCDQGTSGGIHGEASGYCLMIGAEPEAYERLKPAFAALAGPQGCERVGPPGAGHFAKMVHNAVEYGMMQALAEGFELLEAAERTDSPGLDPLAAARAWQRGSVVRSWLLDLSVEALARPPGLAGIAPVVADSGEGRWCLETATRLGVPVPALAAALFARFRSQDPRRFGDRLLAAMRHGFGGHAVREAAREP